MKNSQSKKTTKNWTIKDSNDYYNIDKWGHKYFYINEQGNISVASAENSSKKIDLYQLIQEIKSRKVNPPLIIRFNDILKDRIKELNNSFEKAITTYSYKNVYQGVFPIKCNQQKNLVEKIIEYGSEWNFGLEVGSKSELIIGLSNLKNENSLLICNGYKDNNYIEMAILARKLEKQPIIVIEQREEVKRIIEAAKKLGSTPLIGIRSKLSSKSIGRWSKSVGEKSKFGLSAPEIMLTIQDLKKADLLKELKLLHFHIGSQISDIKIIKDALQEASQIFVELAKLGAPMEYLDVGGGLGIDYDGSKTSSDNSTNYSLQNYANDVVATIKDSCEQNNVKHPVIITESGRSITSHCSVLIFNILGKSNENYKINDSELKDASLIIKNLIETLNQLKLNNQKDLDLSKIIELWNDAKKFKEDSFNAFRLGFASLQERALAEKIHWACAKEIANIIEIEGIEHSDLKDINKILASTYYANFSIFQSTPDTWAINQVFPIIPIHRHKEKPLINATFADLTCDSDGKLNNFINNGNFKTLLKLHELNDNQEYYIGIFLAGAYQEALSNLHNLFGNTNIIHIDINQNNSYKISDMIKEDSKTDVLKVFDYKSDDLVEMIRLKIESAISNGTLTIEESQKLLAQIETSLRNSTYLAS